MNALKIVVIFTLVLFSFSGLASPEWNDHLRKVEDVSLAMEINSSLYQSTQKFLNEINLEFDSTVESDVLKVEAMLLEQAEIIIEKSALLKEERLKAKKALANVKWRALSQWFIERLKSVRSFIRQKGIFYVGYALSTNILQFTIPSALLYADQPLMAFVVFHIVGDIPVYLYYRAVSTFFHREKMSKMIGKEFSYREIRLQERELKKLLAVNKVQDWIYTPSSFGDNSVRIKKSGFFSKMKQRIGLNTKEVSLHNLTKFFSNDLLEKYPDIQLLFESDFIDEQMKTLLISVKALKDFDSDDLISFKEKFSDSFFENRARFKAFPIKEWIDDCFMAKDFSEFRFKLLNPPKQVKYVRQYNELWKEVILPRVSENFSLLTFNEYRSLVLHYDHFYASQIRRGSLLVDDVYMNLMSEYFDLSIENMTTSCAEKFDQKIGNLVDRVMKKMKN